MLEKPSPPSGWKIPVIIASGIFTGLALFSLYISRATSYLGDNPETCVNCHIMAPQYATWYHSAHRGKTNCNDCHVPHNNVFNKYFFKAKDGLRHATIFSLRKEPQVIFIKEAGAAAVQKNCIRCHKDLITDSRLLTVNTEIVSSRMERSCTDCHRETPHGRVNSLSAVPWARVPLPESPLPHWLNGEKNKRSRKQNRN
ncbi:MAG TPA: cytochrome c nitrite reductase small subunit [Bacteroidales bacterium]|nr:cytochrome c nitrite reductase small subunit [Bacteroidales bacterium]HRT88863.1 cytochrome c nitrite reductase small subunit [Bacteroidales bacterium]